MDYLTCSRKTGLVTSFRIAICATTLPNLVNLLIKLAIKRAPRRRPRQVPTNTMKPLTPMDK